MGGRIFFLILCFSAIFNFYSNTNFISCVTSKISLLYLRNHQHGNQGNFEWSTLAKIGIHKAFKLVFSSAMDNTQMSLHTHYLVTSDL